MERSLQSINLTPRKVEYQVKTKTVKKTNNQVLFGLKFATIFRNISGSPQLPKQGQFSALPFVNLLCIIKVSVLTSFAIILHKALL